MVINTDPSTSGDLIKIGHEAEVVGPSLKVSFPVSSHSDESHELVLTANLGRPELQSISVIEVKI